MFLFTWSYHTWILSWFGVTVKLACSMCLEKQARLLEKYEIVL